MAENIYVSHRFCSAAASFIARAELTSSGQTAHLRGSARLGVNPRQLQSLTPSFSLVGDVLPVPNQKNDLNIRANEKARIGLLKGAIGVEILRYFCEDCPHPLSSRFHHAVHNIVNGTDLIENFLGAVGRRQRL